MSSIAELYVYIQQLLFLSLIDKYWDDFGIVFVCIYFGSTQKVPLYHSNYENINRHAFENEYYLCKLIVL